MPVFTIASVRKATPSTRIVRLELGNAEFDYQAGQAVMIGPADHTDRVPYSIASSPEESARHSWLEFLIKVEGSGRWGHAAFEPLRRGAQLAVDGPYGAFVFPRRATERDFLFIAGGAGIAPLRSMIRHAIAMKHPGRMRLLYSARTPMDFAYLPELRRLARQGRLQLALTATREVPRRWSGERGRITLERLAPLIETPVTLCFVCGPAAMVDDVPRMLAELGIEGGRIRLEEW